VATRWLATAPTRSLDISRLDVLAVIFKGCCGVEHREFWLVVLTREFLLLSLKPVLEHSVNECLLSLEECLLKDLVLLT
jgi:hypothetical protein